MVVVALKGMLVQVTEFPRFQKKSKIDGFVWMATFLAVTILSIDIGLLVGIVLSILCIFWHSIKAEICVLGNVSDTELYLDIDRFEKATEIPFVKMLRYSGSINFATKASFRNRLCNKLGIDLLDEMKHADIQNQKPSTNGKAFSTNIFFNHLILDFSALSSIDPSSVKMLTALIIDFNKLNVKVSVAGCSSMIYEILLKNEFDFMSLLYPSIADAVRSN